MYSVLRRERGEVGKWDLDEEIAELEGSFLSITKGPCRNWLDAEEPHLKSFRLLQGKFVRRRLEKKIS